MVCARVRAIMHSLTLMHYRYVHVHNHAITKTYPIDLLLAFVSKTVYYFPYSKLNHTKSIVYFSVYIVINHSFFSLQYSCTQKEIKTALYNMLSPFIIGALS